MAKTAKNSNVSVTGQNYPYHLLDTALKLGEAVFKHGGRTVPKSMLAGELKMKDAAFSQLCTSARTFGIVDGTRDLSLTELGFDYFQPTSDSSKRLSELGFLITPKLFDSLVRQYDGNRFPSAKLLNNIANRDFGVAKSWAARAVAIFFETVEKLGIVDSNGILRYESAVQTASRFGGKSQVTTYAPNVSVESTGNLTPENRPMSNVPMPTSNAATNVNVWTFSEGGGTVRLELSDPIPWELWDRLKRYVVVIEPSRPFDSKPKGGG